MESPLKTTSRSREVMLIESFREAEALIKERKTKLNGQLVIRIPEVPVDESLRWERGLNEAFQECGCLFGARCGFVALCGTVIWGCFQFANPAFTWRVLLREMLIVVILGSILGKLLGLSLAKLRIFRIVREIRKHEGRLTAEECHSETGQVLAGGGKIS